LKAPAEHLAPVKKTMHSFRLHVRSSRRTDIKPLVLVTVHTEMV